MILTEDKVMDRLQTLAEVAFDSPPVSGAKIAAMVEYKGREIATECNSYKSHPWAKKYSRRPHVGIYLHAEIAALRRAFYYLDPDEIEKSTMYICRVKKDGSWGLSKSCSGCRFALSSFGIEEVYYSTESGYEKL